MRVTYMYKNDSGKLTVYASAPNQRLQSVRAAAEETAKQLNLSFKIVKQRHDSTPIYIYYECGDDEPIPIYCDEGKISNLEEISSKIRNMMFVLSFHPKHSELRGLRQEILKLS